MLPRNLRQDAGDSRHDGGAPLPAIEGRGDRMIFSAIILITEAPILRITRPAPSRSVPLSSFKLADWRREVQDLSSAI